MNNSIAPIEDLIEEGLVQAFRRIFDTELTISNSSNKRELAQRRSQNKTLSYPLCFAELQTMALSTTSYRSQTMLRRGILGSTTSDKLGTFKLPLIPTDLSYKIDFITNSYSQTKKFGKLWLMSATAGFLSFDVTYGVAHFGVRVELDRQVSIPQKEGGPDGPDEYELTANLIVQGYMSHDKLMAEQAANQFEVSGQLTDDLEKALAQSGGSGSVEVFKFTKEWPIGDGPLTR